MKAFSAFWFATIWTIAGAAAEAAISDAEAAALMVKYNCQGCHAVDQKVVGPAFRDIAKKYATDSGAAGKLQRSVKNGSTGVWGSIPMPPNTLPGADLAALAQWILSLK